MPSPVGRRNRGGSRAALGMTTYVWQAQTSFCEHPKLKGLGSIQEQDYVRVKKKGAKGSELSRVHSSGSEV